MGPAGSSRGGPWLFSGDGPVGKKGCVSRRVTGRNYAAGRDFWRRERSAARNLTSFFSFNWLGSPLVTFWWALTSGGIWGFNREIFAGTDLGGRGRRGKGFPIYLLFGSNGGGTCRVLF